MMMLVFNNQLIFWKDTHMIYNVYQTSLSGTPYSSNMDQV